MYLKKGIVSSNLQQYNSSCLREGIITTIRKALKFLNVLEMLCLRLWCKVFFKIVSLLKMHRNKKNFIVFFLTLAY